MTCQHLHGARARYVWIEGQLECQDRNGTLTLRGDDGCVVMNLKPEHVQVITLLEELDPCVSLSPANIQAEPARPSAPAVTMQ